MKLRNRWRLMIIRFRHLSFDGATEHKSGGTPVPKDKGSVFIPMVWHDLTFHLQWIFSKEIAGAMAVLRFSKRRCHFEGCESEQVNVNRYTFQSYANGKSAVRVAAKEAWWRGCFIYRGVRLSTSSQVRPAGPHLWRDGLNQDLQSVHMDQVCLFVCLFGWLVGWLVGCLVGLFASKTKEVVVVFQGDKGSQRDELKEPFGPPIMVVHYESCPFSRWQDTKMVKRDHILQRCSIIFIIS